MVSNDLRREMVCYSNVSHKINKKVSHKLKKGHQAIHLFTYLSIYLIKQCL